MPQPQEPPPSGSRKDGTDHAIPVAPSDDADSPSFFLVIVPAIWAATNATERFPSVRGRLSRSAQRAPRQISAIQPQRARHHIVRFNGADVRGRVALRRTGRRPDHRPGSNGRSELAIDNRKWQVERAE